MRVVCISETLTRSVMLPASGRNGHRVSVAAAFDDPVGTYCIRTAPPPRSVVSLQRMVRCRDRLISKLKVSALRRCRSNKGCGRYWQPAAKVVHLFYPKFLTFRDAHNLERRLVIFSQSVGICSVASFVPIAKTGASAPPKLNICPKVWPQPNRVRRFVFASCASRPGSMRRGRRRRAGVRRECG